MAITKETQKRIQGYREFFNEGRLNIYQFLAIEKYLTAQDQYYWAGDHMAELFKKVTDPKIEAATTIEELEEVKEYLRMMPESSAKVFIFHNILLKEEDINDKD